MALLTRIRARLAIHAHRRVRGLLDGAYASLHTGRSMDLHDLREYVSGDDVKDIDWRATARRGEVLIRRYVADRAHTVLLVVSTGRTMAGLCDPAATKREVALQVAGALGWLAVRHGDRVGLVVGDAAGQHQRRPAATEVALERHLQAIDDAIRPDGPAADLTALLAYAVRGVRRRTIMVVVTEDVALGGRDARHLRRLHTQHEVLVVTIGDLDPTDPALARQTLVDVTSRAAVPSFVRGDAQLRRELAELDTARREQRDRVLDRLGIAHAHVAADADVVPAVFRLLERQRHARR